MSGVIKGASMLTMLVLMVLIGRYGGADALGAYSLGMTFITIITLLSLLGIPSLLMREVGRNFHNDTLHVGRIKGNYIAALTINSGINMVLASLLFFFAEFISMHIFHSFLLIPVLEAASFVLLPAALITLHSNLIQGAHQPNLALAFQALYTPLFTLIALAIFLYFGVGNANLASMTMKSYAVGAWIVFFSSFYYWLMIAKGVFKDFSIQLELQNFGSSLFKNGSPFLLAGIGIAVLNMADILMLGALSTVAETGHYYASNRLAAGLTLIVFSVNNVLAPKLASSFARADMTSFSAYVRHGVLVGFIPTLILAIAMYVFSSELLNLFGTDFHQAKLMFAILLLGNLFNAIAGPAGWVLNMGGFEKDFQTIILTAATLNIILNFVLISNYGAIGAAIATMTTTVIWNIHSALIAYKRLGVCTVVGLNFWLK